MRPLLLLGIYPLALACLILYGQQYDSAAIAMGAVLMPIIVVASYVVYEWLLTAGRKHRTKVAEALAACEDKNSPEFDELLLQCFLAFDLDKSGFLDLAEIRELFAVAYPTLEPIQYPKAVLILKQFSDHAGQYDEHAAKDAIRTAARDLGIDHLRGASLKGATTLRLYNSRRFQMEPSSARRSSTLPKVSSVISGFSVPRRRTSRAVVQAVESTSARSPQLDREGEGLRAMPSVPSPRALPSSVRSAPVRVQP